MTFKDIYDFVNDGGKAVVYNLVKNAGDIKQAQFMSDYTIYQEVVYAAKIEQYDDSMLQMFGWPSVSEDIVLFDNDNNEIARGPMTKTHTRHVFFTRDEVLAGFGVSWRTRPQDGSVQLLMLIINYMDRSYSSPQ